MERTWTTFRRVAHSAGTCDPRLPTAAFDFDSTLRPYRGRGPAEELTLGFLAGLAGAFNLAVVSNRASADPAALAPLRAYAAALDARTGAARATFYAATARDRDRKPHTGAWEHYLTTVCGGARPPFAFYCGDAAGRPGDFSDSDLLFAHNAGLAFVTPEALFAGGGDPWAEGARLLAGAPALGAGPYLAPGTGAGAGAPAAPSPLAGLGDGARTCVVLCGSPGSGKSRLAAQLAGRGWALVGRDLQQARHRAAFDGALRRGESVVADNTNPTPEDRAAFARPARAQGYRVVICHVATPKALCFHLSAARCQLDPAGATPGLPPVAIHAYWKRRVAPTAEEAAALGAELLEVSFTLAEEAPPEVTHFRYPLK